MIPLRDKKRNVVIYAQCSQCDYQELMRFKWCRTSTENFKAYAKSTIEGKQYKMHKYVMERVLQRKLRRGEVVDHVNRDKLDNRRKNLRVVSKKQNGYNRSKRKGASSNFRGVSKTKVGKYKTTVGVNGRQIYLGLYENEVEAALAYDKYIAHHPELIHEMNWESRREEFLCGPLPVLRKSSHYRGVSQQSAGSYIARVTVDGEVFNLLSTMDEKEAARTVDSFIIKCRLNRKLNFPEEHPYYVPTKPIRTRILNEINADTIQISISNSLSSVVLIDRDDYLKVKHLTCYLGGNGYPSIQIRVNKRLMGLSRYLLGVSDPLIVVDHIDNNPLNNRKINLRKTTRELNAQNKKKRYDSASEYHGVTLSKSKKCIARVSAFGVTRQRSFNDLETASRWRDLMIMSLDRPNLFTLNFVWTDADVLNWKTKLKIGVHPWKKKIC